MPLRADGVWTEATVSDDGVYRYTLSRSWGERGGARICWVMLNPSTADALQDDQTIRKIIRFSKSWRYQALDVVNLFALRTTDPKKLYLTSSDLRPMSHRPTPVGIENNAWIQKVVVHADLVMAAWGRHGQLYGRDYDVLKLLRETRQKFSPPICVLGFNKDGTPKHPLYLKDTLKPQRWEGYE